MNFDFSPLPQNNHLELQAADQESQIASQSFQPLPDGLDDSPAGSPIAHPSFSLAIVANVVPLSGVAEEAVAKKAVACAIVEAGKSVLDSPVLMKSCLKEQKLALSQNGFHKQVHFAAGHQLAEVVSPPPRSLSINIITCSRSELITYLQTNRELSYVYKLRAMLDQVESYCSSKNLTLEEIQEVKSKLDVLALQRPYTTREDLGLPSPIQWPPDKITTRSPVSSLKVEITKLYIETYGHLLTDIDSVLSRAEKNSDSTLKTECRSLLNNQLLFPFAELLLYAVATGHFDLLEKTFSDCKNRVREAVNDMLDQKADQKLRLLSLEGGDDMQIVASLTADLFLFADLEQCKDEKSAVNIFSHFIQEGGDILHCYDDEQTVLSCYASSDWRKQGVMDYLFLQAEGKIRSLLATVIYKNGDELFLVVDYIRRLAEVPDLNMAAKHFVLNAAQEVLEKAKQNQLLLSEPISNALQQIIKQKTV